ncbi:bis(5'-nucleosyl)-tetraphosphatase (symmetrical) YqeK [Lacticigenium naphthae]|uniref:bis(5'-nucleosyl)-tetraphosphatase (symmetrical) YqeK n=1 Tax=Lacticigenium naphthae TaxID=515351 RepID=UPI00040381A4|nr:bis(5'-nucleosyl)-tetraphosphatase (symmetrical) YqeK [Lacticigenium naphthae]
MSEEKEYSSKNIRLTRDELISEMQGKMTELRFQHVLRVEKTALLLAKIHKVDTEKTSIAALSHDYVKDLPDEEMRDVIISENMDLELLQYGSNIWHGPVAAVLMKKRFGINDQEILDAIKYHTVGSPHMGSLEKIIYVADFIEPGRNFKGIERARELAKSNLDETVGYITEETLNYLLKEKMRIYPGSIYTYNKWVVQLQEEKNDR